MELPWLWPGGGGECSVTMWYEVVWEGRLAERSGGTGRSFRVARHGWSAGVRVDKQESGLPSGWDFTSFDGKALSLRVLKRLDALKNAVFLRARGPGIAWMAESNTRPDRAAGH